MGNRRLAWTAVMLALGLARGADLTAQNPARRSNFEVASVKPSSPGTGAMGVVSGARVGDQWRAANATLRLLIQSGYRNEFPMSGQIIGGPDWMDSNRFDVMASMPQGTTAPDMITMVRSLLADRFELRVHREQRELPVYVMGVSRSDGRLGPQLRAVAVDCDALRDARLKGEAPPSQLPVRGQPIPDCFTGIGPGRAGYDISSSGISMADLAVHVSAAAGRPVLDRTGLKGFFSLQLTFATEPGAVSPFGGRSPGVSFEPVDMPSLRAAIEEQLGLNLESRRERVGVLIIDGAARPTAD